MTVAVLPGSMKPALAPCLPAWVDARFFDNGDELVALAPEAEIGWFDYFQEGIAPIAEAVRRAERMRWLVTIGAGVDFLPLDILIARGVMITKGSGLNAVAVAEYTVMAMLAQAKNYREVVRAQDRREWLADSPGKRQLAGSRALLVGYGAIGRELAQRLRAFAVEVVPVSRSGRDGSLRPDEWQARLGEFDWVILAAPSTDETRHAIGAAELAAMKADAVLVNVARGTLVDQQALAQALTDMRIGGALLDVTEPEPLPADDPLWAFDNVQITMHLSGRAQDTVYAGAVERFLANLEVYRAGRQPQPLYDPAAGY